MTTTGEALRGVIAQHVTLALIDRKDASGLSWNEAQAIGTDVARRVDSAALTAAVTGEGRTRWHHSPDAPPEHFCEDCDSLLRRALTAERALAAQPVAGAVPGLPVNWPSPSTNTPNVDEHPLEHYWSDREKA